LSTRSSTTHFQEGYGDDCLLVGEIGDSSIHFQVSAKLDAIKLNYGCCNGACGLCKARVVSGSVAALQAQD
jgi:hypothetical protein